MNKKQREIITDAYEQYIRNAMRGDPVGGFSDFADLFSRLRETDKRLDEELQEAIAADLPDIPSIFISSVSGYHIRQLKDMLWEALQRDNQ